MRRHTRHLVYHSILPVQHEPGLAAPPSWLFRGTGRAHKERV